MYFGTLYNFGAIDRKTGELLFKQPIREDNPGACVAFSKDTLYASVGKRGLLACDPKTGKVRWSVPGSYYGIEPLAINERVLTILRKGFVSAVGIKEHKALWTIDVRRSRSKARDASELSGPSALAQLDQDRVLVGSYDAEVFCLNATTGKQLWKTSFKLPEYGGEITSIAVGSQVLIARPEEIVALEPDTGRILWHFTREEGSFCHLLLGPEGTVFTLSNSGILYGLSAATGEQHWSLRLTKSSDSRITSLVSGKGGVLVGIDDSLQAISPTGKILWTWTFPDNALLTPLLISEEELFITGAVTLYRYIPGQSIEIPTDREARRVLAHELAGRLRSLTRAEGQMLDSLGDEAFEALFPIAQQRLDANTLLSLAQVMQPKHTASILELLKKTDSDKEGGQGSYRDYLFRILAGEGFSSPFYCPARERSDPELVVPIFLKELEEGQRNAGLDSALSYVSRSSHPKAHAFLKSKLVDPKASPMLRRAAFQNLARIGGASFVPDILAARDTNRKIPSLASCIRVETLPATPDGNRESPALAELITAARDKKGSIWGLIRSHVLGTGDLWVVRREGERWVEPIFTGQQLGEKGPPKNWLTRFTGNPALRRDTDSDGWTDLVEKRLGTNPKQADTDGDGLKDSEDANPLAASHSLSDTEKVLQAAFEARYRIDFEPRQGAICLIYLPDRVSSLEFSSWGWVVIPRKENQKMPLDALVGKGVISVGFGLPHRDFTGAGYHTRKSDFILWNSSRTRAKLSMSTYVGPIHGNSYDIELQKFGDDWVVVRCEMTLIS